MVCGERLERLYIDGERVDYSQGSAAIDSHGASGTGIGAKIDATVFHDGSDSGSNDHHFEGVIGELSLHNQAMVGHEVVDLHVAQLRKWTDKALSLDYETATSHAVGFVTNDAVGHLFSDGQSVVVDNGVEANQSLPGPQSVNENTDLIFNTTNGNAVSVNDSVAGTDSLMQITLSVNNGVLTFSQTTGLTFVEGGNGNDLVVVNGAESDINAALDGMSFTPNANFAGSVTLNMTTALAANIEGHYTFDGDANDQSKGTAYDGALNGDAAIVNTVDRGQVLSLDGAGDFVRIDGLMGEPTDMTLAAWINADSVDGGQY